MTRYCLILKVLARARQPLTAREILRLEPRLGTYQNVALTISHGDEDKKISVIHGSPNRYILNREDREV